MVSLVGRSWYDTLAQLNAANRSNDEWLPDRRSSAARQMGILREVVSTDLIAKVIQNKSRSRCSQSLEPIAIFAFLMDNNLASRLEQII